MWDFLSLFEVLVKGFEGSGNVWEKFSWKSEEYVAVSGEGAVEIDPWEIHDIPSNRDFGDIAFKADIATHHENVGNIGR